MAEHALSRYAGRVTGDPIADIFSLTAAAQRADPDFISLAAGAPDDEVLPADLLSRLLDEVEATDPTRRLGNYTDPQGLPVLRQQFERHLHRIGVDHRADDLLITSGGMEGITLAAKLLLDPGDVVLVESPAFPGALATFALLKATVVHVGCDEDGMRPDALAHAIGQHRPKLVFLMADYQNPTGWVMPVGRRREIARILTETRTLAVEDGVYAMLGFDRTMRLPVRHFAPEWVIYITSASKVMLPAMRVGVFAAPPRLTTLAKRIKSTENMQASSLNQALTSRFLDAYLDTNLARLSRICRRRRQAMLSALGISLPGCDWTRPSGGMFVWLRGPRHLDLSDLLRPCIAAGTAYVPGSLFYATPGRGSDHARLNFASVPEGRIEIAVSRLAEVLSGYAQ